MNIAVTSDVALASPYERGKARRRQRILNTAIEIISEQGEDALTIRAIAARAGLSPVTVYNLFGSKQAIIEAAYVQDYTNLIGYFEANASDEPLERIFDLITLSTAYYEQRPLFYRALFGALIANSRSDMAVANWGSRATNMQELLLAAIQAGMLKKNTPVDVLAPLFIRLGRSITQEWVDGSLSFTDSREAVLISYYTIIEKFTTRQGRQEISHILAEHRQR